MTSYKHARINQTDIRKTGGVIEKTISPFEPLPWQKKVLNDMSPVLLLAGSAGGGKSHAYAEKIHAACLKYPGAEWIVARKIKEDVLDSCYRLLKQKVIGPDPRVSWRVDSASYSNGSFIYFIGMRGERERASVRSIGTGAICGAWMEEAYEFEEEDFDELLGRVRGTQMGWTQIGLSTNPFIPLHWVRRRLMIGKEATVLLSSEKDNPYNDDKYRIRLRNMKGVRGQRLRDGLWVESSGLVISTFYDDYDGVRLGDPVGNVQDSAEYNPDGAPIEIWADNGYAGEWDEKAKMFKSKSHPRVFLLVQPRPDGGFNVFAESYEVQMEELPHLEKVKMMCEANGWPWPPSRGIYDSASPSLGSYLRTAGVRSTHPGTKNMDDSIIVLRTNVAADHNGRRMINIHPRCRLLRLETGSWTYEKNGRPGLFMDNGPDALRYGVYYHKGPDVGKTDVGTSVDDPYIDELMDRIDLQYEQFVRKVGVNI